MKIHLDSDEHLEVVVPSRLNTSTEVWVVDDRGTTLIEVALQDGLIGAVREHVVRRHAAPIEDRLKLWGHLVSEHAGIFPLQMTLEELIDMHDHEHTGPGTIRDHPRESRAYSLRKIGKVLSEAEPDPPKSKLLIIGHAYLSAGDAAGASGDRPYHGCYHCNRPRSEHEK